MRGPTKIHKGLDKVIFDLDIDFSSMVDGGVEGVRETVLQAARIIFSDLIFLFVVLSHQFLEQIIVQKYILEGL